MMKDLVIQLLQLCGVQGATDGVGCCWYRRMIILCHNFSKSPEKKEDTQASDPSDVDNDNASFI